jgi:hypothetical protein
MATEDPTTPAQLPLSLEEWRPVVGWEGLYEVSDHGHVRSIDRPVLFKQRYGQSQETVLRTRIASGQLLTPQGTSRGLRYLWVTLWRQQKPKRRAVHHLVLEAFVGPQPLGYVTNHKDGNPGNNHVGNLEWCTATENNVHAIETGLRKVRGEGNYLSYFTEADVLLMRQWAREGMTSYAIAQELNLPRRTVHNVVTRRTWKHVP